MRLFKSNTGTPEAIAFDTETEAANHQAEGEWNDRPTTEKINDWCWCRFYDFKDLLKRAASWIRWNIIYRDNEPF
jgi:hypothetical protein